MNENHQMKNLYNIYLNLVLFLLFKYSDMY